MTTKADLHRLVDALPEAVTDEAAQLLAALEAREAALPAVLRHAPLAEPEPDELEALAELDLTEPSISNEVMKRELGL